MTVKLFVFVFILTTTGVFYFSSFTNEHQDISKIKLAYSVSKGQSSCNCTLDFIDNTNRFELPNVKIIKNESMQSQTEGTLVWTESKQLARDGAIVGDIYLANQSAGALVDLNTIKVEQNQLLGLEITGGTLPDIVRSEIVNPITPMNGTGLKIGDIKIGKKISESTIVFNKLMNEPSLNQNSFRVQVPPEGGDMVLIVSLLYNSNDMNSNNTTSTGIDITKSSPLITGIYKSVLTMQR
jgi:hypothetical protein